MPPTSKPAPTRARAMANSFCNSFKGTPAGRAGNSSGNGVSGGVEGLSCRDPCADDRRWPQQARPRGGSMCWFDPTATTAPQCFHHGAVAKPQVRDTSVSAVERDFQPFITWSSGPLRCQLAQYVLQQAAIAEVFDLLGREQQYRGSEDLAGAIGPGGGDRGGPGLAIVQTGDIEGLGAVQSQRRGAFALAELQRQYPHADQIGAVDAFEALGDHRLHPQQVGALGRPVARGAGAVL